MDDCERKYVNVLTGASQFFIFKLADNAMFKMLCDIREQLITLIKALS